MNKAKRDNLQGMSNRLTEIKGQLEDLAKDLESVKDEERDSFDNLPESLQQADQGQNTEQAASYLADAHSALEEIVDNTLDEVINNIDEAIAL